MEYLLEWQLYLIYLIFKFKIIYDNYNMYNVLKDSLFGAFFIGSLSYLNEKFKNSIYYPKIAGFLIAIPIGYLLGINVFLRNNTDSAVNYSKHIVFGLIITLLTVIFSIYLLRSKLESLIYLFNICVLILIIYFYFHFKIFELY